MALERFIPKSPDANIRNTQDFEVAKFGHLNTIVEYINSYVVADGLQLSGTGPLSTTLRAITDNIGNTSKLLLSTTSTAVFNDFRFLGAISGYVALEAPNSVTTYTLKLPSTTGSAGQAIITDGSGNLSFGTVTTNPSGVAGAIQFSNGSAFASDAANLFWDDTNNRLGIGTNAPTNTFEIASTSASPFKVATTASYFRAIFQNSGASGIFDFNASSFQFPTNNVEFGTSSSLGARVGIKGSGSTSATTSLLVQNSSGTTLLRQYDDGNLRLYTGSFSPYVYTSDGGFSIYSGGNFQLAHNGGINSVFFSSYYYTGDIYARYAVAIGNISVGTINASAQLQVDSTTKGFLPPRMTTAQKNAIATPAAGLVVYDTDLNKLCVYTTAWQTITSV